jgi:hypothetical protein
MRKLCADCQNASGFVFDDDAPTCVLTGKEVAWDGTCDDWKSDCGPTFSPHPDQMNMEFATESRVTHD